jgi:hypothetical protein
MSFSEKTLIKAIVNYKCNGYLGKHVKHFTMLQRRHLLDELESRNWLVWDKETGDGILTEEAQTIILKNLDLCD